VGAGTCFPVCLSATLRSKNISKRGPLNCRSLHFATPDFLWKLVALVYFMRPSLRKGAQVVLSSAAWQEIRVRSGRDDKGGSGALSQYWFVDAGTADPSASLGMTKGAATLPRKVVAGQGAFHNSRVRSAVGLSGIAAHPFVIPSEAEGSAV
jgi:hypothetical protein